MNILIIGYDKLSETITAYTKDHIAQIKKVLPGSKITLTADPRKVKNLLPDTEIIITSPFLQHMIDLKIAKNLKWVHLSSAGATDLAKILSPTKILLTNSSGVHRIPISEHVFGMLLMFARRLNESYRIQIEQKTWQRDINKLRVFELHGKTLGIVGYGRIGTQIAKLAKGFGMKVAVLQHSKKPLRPLVVDGVFRDVNELLSISDFVIDCLPLTDGTLGYFDLKKFRTMRRSALFINIGRGKTVVERDLIKALKSNLIAGAGLDVFEEEPTPDSNPLWELPNVILTPHYSGWTPYYTDRVIKIFCSNLKAYIKGKTMPNLVDKTRGY